MIEATPCQIPTRRPAPALLATLFAALLAGWPSPVSSGDDAPPELAERIVVDLVNVDAYVTDRQGRAVRGLTRDDFRILVDGEPIEISNFSVLEGAETSRGLREGPPPSAATPSVSAESTPHLVVFLAHPLLGGNSRVLPALSGFIDHSIETGGIVMLTAAHHLGSGFLRDRIELAAELEDLRRGSARRRSGGMDRHQTRTSAATARDELEAQGFRRGQQARDQLDDREILAALGRTVRFLAGVPGRKALLYVGARPSSDPELELAFLTVLRDANAYGVTLLGVDPRGHGNQTTLSAVEGGLPEPGSARVEQEFEQMFKGQDWLLRMAQQTGGEAVINTYNFAGSLERIAEGYASAYLLGFHSAGRGDGRYRRIQVAVNRPDLRVRHRAGFLDKPFTERVADRTLSRLLVAAGTNPLDVRIEVGEARRQRRARWLLPLEISVPVAGLTLLPGGEDLHGELRVYLAVRGEKGFSDVHEAILPLRYPRREIERGEISEVRYTAELQIDERDLRIAVGVWDEIAGVESFTTRELEIDR